MRGRRPHYTHRERVRRAAAVQHHIQQHGYVCQACPINGGADHPADPITNPLTADHLHPVHQGGAEGGPLAVRCRRWNSTLGGRPR